MRWGIILGFSLLPSICVYKFWSGSGGGFTEFNDAGLRCAHSDLFYWVLFCQFANLIKNIETKNVYISFSFIFVNGTGFNPEQLIIWHTIFIALISSCSLQKFLLSSESSGMWWLIDQGGGGPWGLDSVKGQQSLSLLPTLWQWLNLFSGSQ